MSERTDRIVDEALAAERGKALRIAQRLLATPPRVSGGSGLKVNPAPLVAKPILKCVRCGMRAPWCKCGKADYR